MRIMMAPRDPLMIKLIVGAPAGSGFNTYRIYVINIKSSITTTIALPSPLFILGRFVAGGIIQPNHTRRIDYDLTFWSG